MSLKIADLFSIAGKTAVVTGGSRGIGRMIADAYVQNGVRTYITARKAEACEQAAAEMSAHGECIAMPADLSTREGRERFVAGVSSREDKLDILVNNAIAPGPFESQMMDYMLDKFGDRIRAENPLGRIGNPRDMAGLAIYLASAAAAYVNGQVIALDGGRHLGARVD